MNIQNKYISLGKSILSGALCAGVLSASIGVQANTQQEVSQVPLGLSEGVPPNMIFTLDESGSMSWGYTPDNLDNYFSTYFTNRRLLSSSFNSQYYNPSIAYKIPPTFDKNGVEYGLETSFEKAYHNGFIPGNAANSSSGYLNLKDSYQATREHRIPSGTFRQFYNPELDFYMSEWITVSVPSSSGYIDLDNGFSIKYNNYSQCKVVLNGVEYETGYVCLYNYNFGNRRFSYRYDLRNKGVPAYYYVYNPSNDASCTIDKEECYFIKFVTDTSGTGPAGPDERENFAIWFSFYKTRALATLSATSIAFYDLSSDVRFTWQNLATCTSFTGTTTGGSCGANSLKPYSTKHKGEFYTWLRSVYFNKSTPLPAAMKRAGEYLSTSKTPWHKYPGGSGNTPENTYACRPSYHVLMTDGMWNETTTMPSNFISDDENFTTPAGTTKSSMGYTKQKPFYDSTGKTLADIAMHYWATDLSSLANRVPSYIPYKKPEDPAAEYWDPRNNPAEWQHMSNFIMGLGLSNSLKNPSVPWAGSTFAGEGYAKLKAGTATWPPASSGNDNNVYDLWHAAINSRGEFYSVDTPEAMVQAFQDILTRIADRKSSAAMPGESTSLEADGAAERLVSYFYETTFDSGEGWTGNIQKVKKYRKYDVETRKFENVVEEDWNAKAKMPAPNSRKIMIAGSGDSKLQTFTTSNAGSPSTPESLASYLNVNPEPSVQVATWEQRLDYLRGSSAQEGEGVGKLRPRTSILGDFLSSQPVVVQSARYLEGFANRLEGNEAYTAFMKKVAGTDTDPAGAQRKGQLYIGGNDGMLHAFDASSGVETFAFIPTAVFPKLNKLTGKNYSHEFYVDGTPVVADVYDGSKWRTILVGTLRAGGKGLFALDITDPGDIKLLWELNANSAVVTGDVKPGYSFPRPTIARLHNGKWAVVTGNGYKGDGANNGAAALYVIDAIKGTMIQSLEVQSPNTAGGENGLSSPRLADYDSDGVADYAYAGDLHGNLWRFDLLGDGAKPPTLTPPSNGSYGAKNGGTTNFAVSYGGKPMFTATSTTDSKPQPITSAPSLVRHPTRTGHLVMFGTGKYFELGDKTGETTHAQTLYGIWDIKTKAENTKVTADTIARGQLQKQTITSETTGTGKVSGITREARIISNEAVEWYQDFDSSKPVVKRGWYLDLTSGSFTGEMIIENMETLGSMLLLQTLVPNDDPCASGSTNWYYAINPATGGRTLHHAFDTRAKDGTNDVIVSAIKYGTEGGVPLSPDEEGFKIGDERVFPPPESIGRQTWRMVPDA